MARIFVSYRRQDSRGATGRLCDRLQQHFGAREVFRDIDSLEPGADFLETIETTIRSASVMLVVIGPRWIEAWSETERSGPSTPEDYVRLEIATAIRAGTLLIPVLVEGARMPVAAEIPDSIDPLAARHAHVISEERWHDDVNRLIAQLETLLPPARPAVPVRPRALTRALAAYAPDLLRLIVHPRREIVSHAGRPTRGVDAVVFFCLSHLLAGWLIALEGAVRSVPRFVAAGLPSGLLLLGGFVVLLHGAARLARVRTDSATSAVIAAYLQSTFLLLVAAGVAVVWTGLTAADPAIAGTVREFMAGSGPLEERVVQFQEVVRGRAGGVHAATVLLATIVWAYAFGWALVAATACRDVWAVSWGRALAALTIVGAVVVVLFGLLARVAAQA